MKLRCLPLVATMALLATHFAASAQMAAAQPEPAASLAPVSKSTKLAKPKPRMLTPADRRDSISPTDVSRPEGTVTPQVKIPLGPTPPAAPLKLTPSKSAIRTNKPSGVNDSAARCGAISDEAERAACRERLTR
jgi:hypothetical protein